MNYSIHLFRWSFFYFHSKSPNQVNPNTPPSGNEKLSSSMSKFSSKKYCKSVPFLCSNSYCIHLKIANYYPLKWTNALANSKCPSKKFPSVPLARPKYQNPEGLLDSDSPAKPNSTSAIVLIASAGSFSGRHHQSWCVLSGGRIRFRNCSIT